MKVFSVAGYRLTGKTTLVVNLILELKKRGAKVVSIKDIHNEKFSMERPGSNSSKHLQASGEVVFARGLTETYQIWNRQLSLMEMLDHLKADYVIIEGMKSAAVPKIICAETSDQLDQLVDGTVFAISGKFAETGKTFNKMPVLHSTNDIQKIADLVEQKVFEVLPFPNEECCK
ncbi:MAG TPA: molybdopterin-guanine dinucleotide biosynthesis protein MobB, partial [bacterium]|nr:molybdopterin-guanine dinucleotide biosynthesis protein MobB [bacterium]